MYEGSDVPTTDLPEDHAPNEPQALPLDASKLHKVVGYEHVDSHGAGSILRFMFQLQKSCYSAVMSLLQTHP